MQARAIWPVHAFPADSSILTFQTLYCVYRLERNTRETPHQHGPKGTDQYVTVNDRLADAAAQGLQCINCRLKKWHGEQRIRPLLFSHCHR